MTATMLVTDLVDGARWVTTVDGDDVVEAPARVGFIVRLRPTPDGRWLVELRGMSRRQAVCGYDLYGEVVDGLAVPLGDVVATIARMLDNHLF